MENWRKLSQNYHQELLLNKSSVPLSEAMLKIQLMYCYPVLFVGLCPDWEDWDPKKAKENAKEAMDAAEKWLDVPQVRQSSVKKKKKI